MRSLCGHDDESNDGRDDDIDGEDQSYNGGDDVFDIVSNRVLSAVLLRDISCCDEDFN